MMEGKLRAATRLIEDNADNFPLSLDASVTISGVTSIIIIIIIITEQSVLLVCSDLPEYM